MIKSKLAIPPDNHSLPCSVAQTQSSATSTQSESQASSKQGSSGVGDNCETDRPTLGLSSEEGGSGTQMQATPFTLRTSSVPGSRRSAATSGTFAVSVATTHAEDISSGTWCPMVQGGAETDDQYGLDDVGSGIDPPLPKRRKLSTGGMKRTTADGVQPRAKGIESQKVGCLHNYIHDC